MKLFAETFVVWLVATYVCVLVAVAVDFVCGVRKARKARLATTSRGYKMTCDKAVKYFLPMLCLSCVDFLASLFFAAPFLTMAMGAFNIFCEWKSVMETTHEKAEMRRAADGLKLVIDNRADSGKAVADVLRHLLDLDGKEDDHEND